MDDHTEHLRRGFNWLGSSTVVAKVVDFATILVVLLFLTKEQVGIAALVTSIGMVVEAFDGLGTSEALVQARTLSRLQLDTVFWFILAASGVCAALVLFGAPWFAALYGTPGMAIYFGAVALKQPIVGAAVVPLALMNRDLQYERLATVNICSTLAAAIVRVILAVMGAGAWSLVIGNVSSGFFTLLGAQIARPSWPHLRFQWKEISGLVRFGRRTVTSNALEQMFKNIDYLLIGWFYGPAPLAIYRVAFDVAMEPATAVGTLVNRTALPVFARVAESREQVAAALLWSLGRVVVLVAPLMIALILLADPLMKLIHDQQGQSYAAAAWPIKILAAAALLRVTAQLLYPLVVGSGRPGVAARLSGITLLLLGAGLLVVGFTFDAQIGIIAAAAVWLCIYPPLLIWESSYLRRHWHLQFGDLVRALVSPAMAVMLLIVMVGLTQKFSRLSDPKLQIGLVVAMTALVYGGLFWRAKRALPSASGVDSVRPTTASLP